jgi:hypothetical protein
VERNCIGNVVLFVLSIKVLFSISSLKEVIVLFTSVRIVPILSGDWEFHLRFLDVPEGMFGDRVKNPLVQRHSKRILVSFLKVFNVRVFFSLVKHTKLSVKMFMESLDIKWSFIGLKLFNKT